MSFDFWRFMSSPSKAVSDEPVTKKQQRKKGPPPDIRLPWFISAAMFTDIARVLLGTLVLWAIGYDYGDAQPAWFFVLLIAHGAAMIIALVFVLNGFGLARLVLIVLAIGQMWFDQTLLTRYFLLADVLIYIVFFIRPASRYFAACEQARQMNRMTRGLKKRATADQ